METRSFKVEELYRAAYTLILSLYLDVNAPDQSHLPQNILIAKRVLAHREGPSFEVLPRSYLAEFSLADQPFVVYCP